MTSNGQDGRGRQTAAALLGDIPFQIGSLLAAFSLVTLYDTYMVWREYIRPAADLYRRAVEFLGLVYPLWVPQVVVEVTLPVLLVSGSLMRARAIARKAARAGGLQVALQARRSRIIDIAIILLTATVLSASVLVWQAQFRGMVDARRAEIVAAEGEAAADAVMAEHTLGVLGELRMKNYLARIETIGILLVLASIVVISLIEIRMAGKGSSSALFARSRIYSVLTIFAYLVAILILCTRVLYG
jgi:hypothetical protein